MYIELTLAELVTLLQSLKQEVQDYTNAAIQLGGFDPFPYLKKHPQTEKNWTLVYQPCQETRGVHNHAPCPHRNKLHTMTTELTARYSSNYTTDCTYLTIKTL